MALERPYCENAEDDYIDIEVSSYPTFHCNSKTSSPNPREFEFQMSSIPQEKEPTTSPADELFYKGKLLPLHLPPRLQMVEKLLQNSNSVFDTRKDMNFEEFYSTPLATTVPTPTTNNTPFQSCNISPSESCRVSRELNPDEYMYEFSTELSDFINENPKKYSWTKKLKKSSIGSKLKASRAYLKSWFGKSGCSHESSTAATKVADEGSALKSKKNPTGQFQKDKCPKPSSVRDTNITEDGSYRHRRSFSMVIGRHSTANMSSTSSSSSSSSSGSSSKSSSNDSNGTNDLQLLKRCSSTRSEIESSIQGAIAHCKQSQQLFRSRKTKSEVGFYALAGSKFSALEEQEKPELCRG